MIRFIRPNVSSSHTTTYNYSLTAYSNALPSQSENEGYHPPVITFTLSQLGTEKVPSVKMASGNHGTRSLLTLFVKRRHVLKRLTLRSSFGEQSCALLDLFLTSGAHSYSRTLMGLVKK